MKKLTFIFSLFIILLIAVISNSCKLDSTQLNTYCVNNTGWIKGGYQAVYTYETMFLPVDTLYIKYEDIGSGIYESTNTFDDGSYIPPNTGYIQPCGNSIYSSSSKSMDDKIEAYRVDGNIGDTWTVMQKSQSGVMITVTNTIVAKNVAVTVEAGTFICLKTHSIAISPVPYSPPVEVDTYIDNLYGVIKSDGTTFYSELVRKNY